MTRTKRYCKERTRPRIARLPIKCLEERASIRVEETSRRNALVLSSVARAVGVSETILD